MRVHKKVLSHDTGLWIVCAWADCEKQGFELHKVIERDGPKRIAFVFCSERHKQYFLNSHISYGNLPSGHRSAL